MLKQLVSTIAEGQVHTEALKQLFVDPVAVFQLLAPGSAEVQPQGLRNLVDVNEEELDHLMAFFDRDKDSKITQADVVHSLRPTKEQVKLALQQIMRQEAINYNKIQAVRQNLQFDPLTEFEKMDEGRRGYITQRGVKKLTQLNNDEISAFFRAVDRDNDGRILAKDFLESCGVRQSKLVNKYKELRKSQERERQLEQESKQLQEDSGIVEQKLSKQRIAQIEQLIFNRQQIQKHQQQSCIKSLLKVRQQLLQIDFIRRNSQRDAFERQLRQHQNVIRNLRASNLETAEKSKYLNEMHDQLYTMRTQQDLSHRRPREFSLHSQSHL